MIEINCKICGREEPDLVKSYSIVPPEILEEAGIERPKTVRICSNCQLELERWYSAKVSNVTYDNGAKQFVPKTASQLVKEYEVAYQWFTRYKKEQLARP